MHFNAYYQGSHHIDQNHNYSLRLGGQITFMLAHCNRVGYDPEYGIQD